MLQAAVATSASNAGPIKVAYARKKANRGAGTRVRSTICLTWSAVELAGNDLADGDFDVSVRLVIEALKSAQSNGKSELLISNIAPDVEVGSAEVTELQLRIEALVVEAVTRLGLDQPEIRLSLRGDEYDLRCYLGRHKPSDYRFDLDR